MTPHHHTITTPHPPPKHSLRAPCLRPQPAKKAGGQASGPESWAVAPRATWPATERSKTSRPGTQAAGSGTERLTTVAGGGTMGTTVTGKEVLHGAEVGERDRRGRRDRRTRPPGMRALGLDRRAEGEDLMGCFCVIME